MPVVYYSQLMSVAYGSSLKQAGLDGHIIQPERLQKIAERKKIISTSLVFMVIIRYL